MIRYTIKLAGRLVLLVAMLFGLGLLNAKVSNAVELLDSDTGYGRAAVFAWSGGYHHIGVVATYSGRSVVRFTIDCNAYRYDDRLSWDDSGPKFRYTQRVPTFGRCNYSAVVNTRGSFIRLGIGAW